jgi:hypothetical protein
MAACSLIEAANISPDIIYNISNFLSTKYETTIIDQESGPDAEEKVGFNQMELVRQGNFHHSEIISIMII